MSVKTDKGTGKLKAPLKCVVEKEQDIHNDQVYAQVQHIRLAEKAAQCFISRKESQEMLPYEEQDESFKSYNNVVKTKSNPDQWRPNNLNFDGRYDVNIRGKSFSNGEYCMYLLEKWFITFMFRTTHQTAIESVLCLIVAEKASIPVPFWLTHFGKFAEKMIELSGDHLSCAIKKQDNLLNIWVLLEDGKNGVGDRIQSQDLEKYLTEQAGARKDARFTIQNMKVLNGLLDNVTFLSNGKSFRPGRDIIRRSVYVEPDKLVEGLGMNQFRPVYVMNQEGQRFQCVFPKQVPQTKPSLEDRLREFYPFCQDRDYNFKIKQDEAGGGGKKGASPPPHLCAGGGGKTGASPYRPPSPPCDKKLRKARTSEHSFVLGLQTGLASYGVEEDEWYPCETVKTEDGGSSSRQEEEQWDSCVLPTVKTEDGEDEWDSCVLTTDQTGTGGSSSRQEEEQWDSCVLTTAEDGGSSSGQGGGANGPSKKRKTLPAANVVDLSMDSE